ncbi:MAG: hypothetical protein RIR97_633 [Pseudomonadota bacterium]
MPDEPAETMPDQTPDDGHAQGQGGPIAEAGTPSMEDRPDGPVFLVPGWLMLFGALLLAIHALRTLGLPLTLDDQLVATFAFVPSRLAMFLLGGDMIWPLTMLTYSLLHGGWEHVIFNCLWMIVFGTPVAIRLGMRRGLAFMSLASVASALGFLVLNMDQTVIVVGASGIVSGLTGASCRFAFGSGLSADRSRSVASLPQLSVGAALSNRSVLMFILFWFAANVLLAVFSPQLDPASTPIAWEAHAAGFLFGFFAFPLFDPMPKGTDHQEA